MHLKKGLQRMACPDGCPRPPECGRNVLASLTESCNGHEGLPRHTLVALSAIKDSDRKQCHIDPHCLQTPVDEELGCKQEILKAESFCHFYNKSLTGVVPEHKQNKQIFHHREEANGVQTAGSYLNMQSWPSKQIFLPSDLIAC